MTDTPNNEVYIEIPGHRCPFCDSTTVHLRDEWGFAAYVACCEGLRDLVHAWGFEEAHGFPFSKVTREGHRLGALEIRTFPLDDEPDDDQDCD